MAHLDVDDLGTIVGVWAHPDDDIYLSAAVMAVAARAGRRVVDVTATRGEGGSMDHDRWPPERMGEIRTAELLRSLQILGVEEHRFLDGPVDVDMDTPLDERGAAQVEAIIAEVQPDTVLTFGPDGMTGHEGHKSVCRWATDAFMTQAKPGASLLYATTTSEWAERWVPVLQRFDMFRPGTPPVTPRDELAVAFDLPPDLAALKVESIHAHESQVEGLFEAFGRDDMATALSGEFFRLGAVKE